MSKINRKTETKGFIITLNDFMRLETFMHNNNPKHVEFEVSYMGDGEISVVIDKNECGLLRDFFSHQFDRMEE